MHSMEGALSESLYIYRPPIEFSLESKTPHILSMGLGIGYNELMALAMLQLKSQENFKILSFESVPELRESFVDWALQKQSLLSECYNQVCHLIGSELGVETKVLMNTLRNALETRNLVIEESLTSKNPLDIKFNGVLYDAFSGGTDQSLWSEEHFDQFMAEYCDSKQCCFSTYAATGALKRSLKKNGFLFSKKAGFGMKRESTLAYLQS